MSKELEQERDGWQGHVAGMLKAALELPLPHQYRQHGRIAAGLSAIGSACLAAYFFQQGDVDSFSSGMLVAIGAGGLLLIAYLLTGQEASDTNDLPLKFEISQVRTRTRWLPTLLGVVLLGLMAEINGDVWDPAWLAHVHYHIQALVLVGGVALLAYGMAGRLHSNASEQTSTTDTATIVDRTQSRLFRPAVRPHPPAPSSLSREGQENTYAAAKHDSLPVNGEGWGGVHVSTLHNFSTGKETQLSTSSSISLSQPGWRSNRLVREIALVLVILLLALGMRLWRLEEAVHLFVDEVHFTNPITHFDDATDVELLLPFSSVAAFPYLYPYLQWNAAQVFGYNLVGLRLVSALFGVLNVAALYLLARELFDRRVAVMAALLLAVFPPHVHFSRLGLNNVADPFFGTMALYFIARGLRSDGWRTLRRDFAYAGAMLGLTQYWYEGGRLLFPPLVLAWGAALLVTGYALLGLRLIALRRGTDPEAVAWLRMVNRYDWRPLLKALLVLGIVTLLVSAPVYYTLVGQGKSLLTRLETAGVGGEERFINIQNLPELLDHFQDQLRRSLMLHLSTPENAHYYRGSTAMLLPVMIPAFLLGLFWALFKSSKRMGASLVLLWIGLAVLGNLLMQDSRITARYVVSFPALVLVAALGLRVVVDLVVQNRRMQNSLLAGMIVGLLVVQGGYYFSQHLTRFNSQFRRNLVMDSHDALFRAAEWFNDETVVILVGERVIPERDAIDYMDYLNPLHGVMVRTPDEFDAQAAASIDRDFDHAFFVEPDDITTIRRLYAFFPQIQGPFFSPYDVPQEQQYAMYFVEREN